MLPYTEGVVHFILIVCLYYIVSIVLIVLVSSTTVVLLVGLWAIDSLHCVLLVVKITSNLLVKYIS